MCYRCSWHKVLPMFPRSKVVGVDRCVHPGAASMHRALSYLDRTTSARVALATRRLATACVFAALLTAPATLAQTPRQKIDRLVAEARIPGVIHSAIGVTRQGTPIPSLLTEDDLDYHTRKTRILLVGGLDGSDASVRTTLAALKWFYTDAQAEPYRGRYALSATPVANPDGWAIGVGSSNGSGGEPARGYRPRGAAYNSPTNPEAAYLWRWIGMHAPDWVIEVRSGVKPGWEFVPPEWPKPELQLHLVSAKLKPGHPMRADRLSAQLIRGAPSGVGPASALSYRVSEAGQLGFLKDLLRILQQNDPQVPSPARREIQRRLDRTPLEIAAQLANHYGHKLDQVAYIPALALLGRIRLGDLTNDPKHLADVEQIVRPYVEGKKPTLPTRASGSNLSGHLIFSELARVTSNPRYIELARAPAELGFDPQGRPKASMPFHNEMSDAVFMGCAILAETGQLTGETKYFDMALRHLKFMLGLDLRPDGLYRHSPLDETAWGRGNGFPALGLALSLTAMPEAHPGRAQMIEALRAHIEALLPHQDPTGMWHQVIDHPESYRELSSTSMITFAMVRGVRSGWLDRAKYEPAIEKAWYGIRTRVGPGGGLVDVCTGTGKQKSRRDYFDRPAVLGHDDRGGAMALMVSTEIAYWERERGR